MIFSHRPHKLHHESHHLRTGLIVFFIASIISGAIFIRQTLTTRQRATNAPIVPFCPSGTPRQIECDFKITSTTNAKISWKVTLVGDPNGRATAGELDLLPNSPKNIKAGPFVALNQDTVSCKLEYTYKNCDGSDGAGSSGTNETICENLLSPSPALVSSAPPPETRPPDPSNVPVTAIVPNPTSNPAIPNSCGPTTAHVCPFCLRAGTGGGCAQTQPNIPAGYSPPAEYACLRPFDNAPPFDFCKPKGNPCTCTVWECRNRTKGLFFAICARGWREDRDGQHCDEWRVLGSDEDTGQSCNGTTSPSSSPVPSPRISPMICPVLPVPMPTGVCK